MAPRWQTSGQATYTLVVIGLLKSLARQICNPCKLCWLLAECIYITGKFLSSVGNIAGQRKIRVPPVSSTDCVCIWEGNRKPIHKAVGSLYPLHVYELMVVWTAISSYWSVWWPQLLKAFLFHLISHWSFVQPFYWLSACNKYKWLANKSWCLPLSGGL